LLTLDALSAGYGDGLALHEVSLVAYPGQVTCVIGRNGAGKTTLAKSIVGVLSASAGRIHFDSQDITKRPTHERAKRGIGWIAQDRGVFPGLSVQKHLALASRFTDDDAVVRAHEQFPILAQRAEVDASKLSGGERKMLQFAMLTLLGPKLIVMDEPTEGVALLIVEQLRRVIAEFARTSAVFLIEQNLETAVKVADRGYVLERGRVAAELDGDAVRSSATLRRWLEL
jgi:branched-chain amino acid transport system ATP-binding protein